MGKLKEKSKRNQLHDAICGIGILLLVIFNTATAINYKDLSEFAGEVIGGFLALFLIYYFITGSNYWLKFKRKLGFVENPNPKERELLEWKIIAIFFIILFLLETGFLYWILYASIYT